MAKIIVIQCVSEKIIGGWFEMENGMKNYGVAAIAVVALLLAALAFTRAPVQTGTAPVAQAQAKESTFERITRTGEITVCYITWPPSVIKDPNTGKLSGFIIDIFGKIANDANLKATYVESTWGGFPADLKTGKCDAAVAGIYPTIGRSTSVSFTEPFFFAGNGAAVKAGDTRFKSIDDMNREGVTIAVLQGEYGHTYAQKYLPKAKLLVLDKSADNTAPLVAVSSGQADAGLIMSDVVSEYAKGHSEGKDLFAAEPYSTSPITWAGRSDDQQLLNFLNNGIGYLKSTGYTDATAKNYSPSGWYGMKYGYEPLS